MTRQAFTPRAYQRQAIEHLLDTPRCALWAGMGLGKTVAALSAADTLLLIDPRPVLVLAPLRVARSTWPDEARKWSHLQRVDVQPVVGSEAERLAALKRDRSVYSMNYENLPWLVDQLGDRWPFGTVIADESTRLKSFRLRQGGKRAQAVARVAHTKVDRWINLTGTPSPNGLIDLWGQTWFLDAGRRLSRSFNAFVQRWFRIGMNGFGYEPLPSAQEQIQDRLRDLCLTIDPRDHFDLREPIVNDIYVDLPPHARRLYRDMEREMFAQIEQYGVEAFNAASRTIKCLQLANGAVYIDEKAVDWRVVHDAKLEALGDVIEEAAGAPVLVAYHFRSDLARLQKAFPRGRVLDQQPQTIADWNAGRIPLLFAHPASAGHGLNLQDGGNILVFFGHWWNLEERMQIVERIGPVRQAQAGYDRPVYIHNIIARDTVDELVIARTESKRNAQDVLLEALKQGKR